MYNLKKRLYKKGWTKEDIQKTLAILNNAKKNKSSFLKRMDKMIFWVILFSSLVITIIISLSLIPILLALSGFFLYFSIIIIATAFGYFFEILLRDIEHLKIKHHILIIVLIPVFSLINFFIIVNYSNKIDKVLLINNLQNPLLLGIFYAIFFLLPYLYFQVYKKRGR